MSPLLYQLSYTANRTAHETITTMSDKLGSYKRLETSLCAYTMAAVYGTNTPRTLICLKAEALRAEKRKENRCSHRDAGQKEVMNLKPRPRCRTPIANTRGITYLLTMMAIVFIGISVTVAAKQWKTMIQRENEADLLARGIEIQMAIAAYSETRKKGRVVPGEVYPLTLDELTKAAPKPFLRKAYRDPITRGDWDYIPDIATGGIRGVRSKSTAATLKQHGFPQAVRHFEGLVHYNEWVFQYPNASSMQSPVPGAQTPSPMTTPPGMMPPGTMPPQMTLPEMTPPEMTPPPGP